MTNEFAQIVAKCVVANVLFEGTAGSVYTVQDLINMASRKTVNTIYKRVKRELDALDTDSLYETSNTAKRKDLEDKVAALKEVFAYKTELENAERERSKRLEKRKALLALRSRKEIEEFEGKTLEEIDAELEALEA